MGERDEVEAPLVAQLVAMGWTHLAYAAPAPLGPDGTGSGRDSYADVVLRERLRAAVVRINIRPDGRPWLDAASLDEIERRIRQEGSRGVPGNLAFAELLTGTGLTLPGPDDWDAGRHQPVHLIDHADPARNDLLVVTQFRVDLLDGDRRYVVPDVVLFVNGLPLVVIECKQPGPTAITEAVTQLLGYMGGAPPPDLAGFVQLLVATDRESARYGTVTSAPDHFARWKATGVVDKDTVRADAGAPPDRALHAQEVLVGELLRPAVLVEFLRDFMVTATRGSRPARIAARWHQHRAVRRITARMLDRRRAIAGGATPDHRGGVVWHTQGSGKSLTMAFLVRRLRTDPELAGTKVVVVTDRLDLEEQIAGSLAGAGDRPRRTYSIDGARTELGRATPDLLLVTIQKSMPDADDPPSTETPAPIPSPVNDSTDIVVLVDEAHRSQSSTLHARLRASVPGAALIGFTGTPILSGTRTTESTFGPLVDVYTLQDGETDGAVVPLRYESREVPAAVAERAVLDTEFAADVPAGGADRDAVVRRFARRRTVLESEQLIAAKADDMFRHWVRHGLPDRFAAQVVAVSRLAAVRYRDALLAARDRFVVEVESVPTAVRHDPMGADGADPGTQELLRALDHLDLIRRVDVAVVISEGRRPDPEGWSAWTDRDRQRETIRRFTAGLGPDPADGPDWGTEELAHHHAGTVGGDPWSNGERPAGGPIADPGAPVPIAFLVVKSMLLTGFDAPVLQALYLDRPMAEIELLQAIARPNRPHPHKTHGLIVDYVAIAADLAAALARYDVNHLQAVSGRPDAAFMLPMDGWVVPELQARHQEVVDLLGAHGGVALDTPRRGRSCSAGSTTRSCSPSSTTSRAASWLRSTPCCRGRKRWPTPGSPEHWAASSTSRGGAIETSRATSSTSGATERRSVR